MSHCRNTRKMPCYNTRKIAIIYARCSTGASTIGGLRRSGLRLARLGPAPTARARTVVAVSTGRAGGAESRVPATCADYYAGARRMDKPIVCSSWCILICNNNIAPQRTSHIISNPSLAA